MFHEIVKKEIRVPGSLTDTYLETFILNVTEKFMVQQRPLVLVCPGGGYHFTVGRSGNAFALSVLGLHDRSPQNTAAKAKAER